MKYWIVGGAMQRLPDGAHGFTSVLISANTGGPLWATDRNDPAVANMDAEEAEDVADRLLAAGVVAHPWPIIGE